MGEISGTQLLPPRHEMRCDLQSNRIDLRHVEGESQPQAPRCWLRILPALLGNREVFCGRNPIWTSQAVLAIQHTISRLRDQPARRVKSGTSRAWAWAWAFPAGRPSIHECARGREGELPESAEIRACFRQATRRAEAIEVRSLPGISRDYRC